MTTNSADRERARQLFASRREYIPGVGVVGPAVHQDALELLKADPDEYFRLNRIWHEVAS